VKENSVLHIKLDEQIYDRTSSNPFNNFNFNTMKASTTPGLGDILRELKKAAGDDRIKGIYLDISDIQAGIATIEEIRNMVAYNFAAQNRAVTLNDYKSMIETMPATYGAPAKVSVMEEDNKVRIKLLSYDENGALIDIVSNTLKNNVLNYLSNYRMLNDYLDIQSGEVIDMGLEIDLVVNKNENSTDIIKSVIEQTTTFFDPANRKMGDPLLVGDLKREIGNVGGVVNVVDVRVYNKIGGSYSSSQVSQSYVSNITKEIAQSDGTIYMKSNQIFQIRFPNIDIKIRTKNLSSTTY